MNFLGNHRKDECLLERLFSILKACGPTEQFVGPFCIVSGLVKQAACGPLGFVLEWEGLCGGSIHDLSTIGGDCFLFLDRVFSEKREDQARLRENCVYRTVSANAIVYSIIT